MARLEDLKKDTLVRGLRPGQAVTVIDAKWHGDAVIEITYKDSTGNVANELLFRDRESDLEIIQSGRSWAFGADAALSRLVSEAYRVRMAYLFDPYLAVNTSLIDPLPHQITAVYGEMLTRQPLRFLLADDPGAGKTIMAGLFIKELAARGDLRRCLICCPGNLADQWQDELFGRFQMPFEILTKDRLESARTGNAFQEMDLLIVRLDQLSRNEELQGKLSQTDWDLIVCDEAHKMSASFFGGEIKETKRYKVGRLLSGLARHFLLMTATPHNGKEEDFQLFMALLDGDRFEGRFRDGVHVVDVSDLMRRMVKERLYKFDGTPLFPERIAYTVSYRLSDLEAILYEQVTQYVREEFNRADALNDDKRKGNVGFALTILQRRLASSPEAIYQSLRRRRERLEKRLREEELLQRGAEAALSNRLAISITEDDLEELEDAPNAEVEALEENFIDQATAAKTIAELRAEIDILKELETLALSVRNSRQDKKWEELSSLLQSNSDMFDSNGLRRKLLIFTEHRDTLNYLTDRIRTLLGRPEAVITIHGALGREDRKKAEAAFKQDKSVLILVATDAAGEGINLQRAHLMVNYDLPWNPNRIEQRFGRIHRIGQTEVCHLWNLVAEETREGDVYLTLLKKLEAERNALGGAVFDVLGKAISGKELRQLLIEAIRYGDQPEVRARLTQKVEEVLDREHLQGLLEEQALIRDSMDVSKVLAIRQEMERAAARRLQPHFIASFLLQAFKHLGGSLKEREPKRYEIRHVPALIRNRDRLIGQREPVQLRYERICFEKELINIPGKPVAAFICPGHPLLDATIDVILGRYRHILKQGAIFVDETDPGENIRCLFYLEHSILDGRTDNQGNRRTVSKQLQFVEIDEEGNNSNAGYAPYLDYRPLTVEEASRLQNTLEEQDWLRGDLESKATTYAIGNLVMKHLHDVKERKQNLVTKTMAAVKERLTKEITYWDHRAEELKAQESAGRINAKMNSAKARLRADELTARLQKRLEELQQELQLSPLPPVVIGGAIVIPEGLLRRLAVAHGFSPDLRSPEGLHYTHQEDPGLFALQRAKVEQMAMEAVMAKERSLGFLPKDVSKDNCGYDIESIIPQTGKLRFIEVKGRIQGAETVTVTKNEILTGMNKPDDFILAVVVVPQDMLQSYHEERPEGEEIEVKEPNSLYGVSSDGCGIHYVREPFKQEPDFGVTSVNYNMRDLMQRASPPS